jgi:hypothetical protein
MKQFDALKKKFPNNVHEMKLDLPEPDKSNISEKWKNEKWKNIPGKVSDGELTITQYVSLMSFH